MNEQAIVQRIIFDANEEAKGIIAEAEKKAAATIADANLKAERNKKGCEAEIKAKATSICEGKQAAARLDSAKILLAEKRGVIDKVYQKALVALKELDEKDTLFLCGRLIKEFAEEGDEVVFAENFKFVSQVAALPIIKELKLKVSNKRADIEGGFMLVGKISDKNLSYAAILAVDREERQAELATKIFN